MELIQTKHPESLELYRSALIPGEGETVLKTAFLSGYQGLFGELVVSEGIEEIEARAFTEAYFHTIHLPKSLGLLGEKLFRDTAGHVKIVYAGNSADFMQIAAPKKEERYETDGYDHYPYYSGNSRWVTYYRSFDERTYDIEVNCTEDGVTLLYGTRNRKNDDPPKIKQ